ncbi:MAG: HAMP domain-containing protein [Deltaproteobacteria bacterium]|nr:HAMP domain-containing protein [Deltaproteobacteria bacterium]
MPYRRLSVKLIFWVGVITVLVIGVFASVNLNTQRRNLLDEAILGAKHLSGTLKRSLRFDMLHNYRDAIYNSIETIGTQEEIEKVRIFNKEGMIMFSSDKEEMGHMVDKKAEACYVCHAVDKPLERLEIPKRSRIFRSGGYRVLGMISPIYNEPDCYNAACHVHPREQKVLGVLDISLSLAATDKRVKEIRDKTILFAAITILAISAIIGLFIQRAVYRPVKELAKGTTRVAAGDFDHTIPSRSEDEIGQLAESFNKMTQRLKAVQYQLLQSEKLASIGKLAATIAHEINNPLNGILTYTKLIERKLTEGAFKEGEIPKFLSYLTIMERETERCSSIVRNLLDFARQREPSLKPDVDINMVVEEAISLLANQIALQEIKVEKRFGQLPPIMADPMQLKQAFLNIILNSCETMQNEGRLTITTAFSDKGKVVKLEIMDNGAGIAKEDLPKIFDPFFTSKEKGTGLGLSVVYGIINSHQGNIEVKSKVDEGTTFIIKLPTQVKVTETSPPAG